MWQEWIKEYDKQMQYYETIRNIKENGSWWQKLRLFFILGSEEYDRIN